MSSLPTNSPVGEGEGKGIDSFYFKMISIKAKKLVGLFVPKKLKSYKHLEQECLQFQVK